VDRTGSIFRIFVLFVSLVRAFLITIQEGAANESPRMARMNADERKTDQKSCSYPRHPRFSSGPNGGKNKGDGQILLSIPELDRIAPLLPPHLLPLIFYLCPRPVLTQEELVKDER
jgi:hypothetical protein